MQDQDGSFQKRFVAFKASVSDILGGVISRDDSFSYIRIKGRNVGRVNVIGTMISKSGHGSGSVAAIDDGTGRISLRVFEEMASISMVDVGDLVIVIGKVREFNDERYIMPEAIKKLDGTGWLSVRRLELQAQEDIPEAAKEKAEVNLPEAAEDSVYSAIKSLDRGDGASFEEVISKSGLDAEQRINELLEKGDIFEIRPGRLKVLE